jgi:hypothetical protein
MPYPSKNNSTYTAPSKNSSNSSNAIKTPAFLLQENGFYLLLESLGKIVLNGIVYEAGDWSYQSKA